MYQNKKMTATREFAICCYTRRNHVNWTKVDRLTVSQELERCGAVRVALKKIFISRFEKVGKTQQRRTGKSFAFQTSVLCVAN